MVSTRAPSTSARVQWSPRAAGMTPRRFDGLHSRQADTLPLERSPLAAETTLCRSTVSTRALPTSVRFDGLHSRQGRHPAVRRSPLEVG